MGLVTDKHTIRVANVIEEAKLGGPQIRMVMAASAMKELVDTTIIMPAENSDAFRKRCEEAGVKYKTFPISRITKEWRVALRYILLSVFEIVKLTRYLKKESFDIVHVSGGSWQYKGLIAGKLAGIQVLWHLNDTSMPILFRKLFRVFSRYADGFIFASERSRQYYGFLTPAEKKYFVIPAPVDAKKYNPSIVFSQDNDLLKKWGDDFVVGTVANINPIKGIEVFIKAASKINEQFHNVRYVVVGPIHNNQKKYYCSLVDLTKELGVNIEFVGGRSDTRALLQRFDIYVCSSHAESSPLSVWEAMAMEKPIVSTNVGDVSVYVKDNVSGYIVDVGDYTALADRISRLIDNLRLEEKIGKMNRKIALNELEVKKCSDRHVQAYRKVIQENICLRRKNGIS